MLLVLRPTEGGKGLHKTSDMESILKLLGYDYLCSQESMQDLKAKLDKGGLFQENELIEHLMEKDAITYSSA